MKRMSEHAVSPEKIKLLVTDVDGIWTTGRIEYDSEGHEIKSFSALDGLAVKLAGLGGLAVALLSARESDVVTLRARQLGIDQVIQGSSDKKADLDELMAHNDLEPGEVLFMGDDLTDLRAMRAAGIAVTVPNAAPDVRARADWITDNRGGEGAVREMVEWVLRDQGLWEQVLARFI
jgi:3-deoxy-D-manno-octulosonate 8-phosphate phosphatase (KDO 8-P phosphatase)